MHECVTILSQNAAIGAATASGAGRDHCSIRLQVKTLNLCASFVMCGEYNFKFADSELLKMQSFL